MLPIISKLKSIHFEEVLFFIASILNLAPILGVSYFVSLDGAAHLYNAKLVLEKLIGGNGTFLDSYFIFNPLIVPNWFGHIYLAGLFNVFSVIVASKTALSSAVIGLAYSFRSLIKTVSDGEVWISWFIFPFIYSFIFFLGFYNFCFGLIFLFLSISYFIRTATNEFRIKEILILMVLNSLAYSCHIFVFAVIQFVCVTHTLYIYFLKLKGWDAMWRKLSFIALASFPGIILSYLYFSSGILGNDKIFVATNELTQWLKTLRLLVIYTKDEEMFSQKIVYVLASVLLITGFVKLNSFVKLRNKQLSFLVKSNDYWIILSAILLILYFTLADSDGSAGFVSLRLCLLFFLFLIIWISSEKLPKWVQILSVSVMISIQYYRASYLLPQIKSLSEQAEQCVKLGKEIKPNSVVLPINYLDNWLFLHFCNFPGIQKPMVILDNYEAQTGYFPLKWNDAQMPNLILGDIPNGTLPCISWKSNLNNPAKKIDYVYIVGNPDTRIDSCTLKVKEVLAKKYTLVNSIGFYSLYKLK